MRSLSVAALLALSLVGCSSTPQSALKLTSQDTKALRSQAFSTGVADVREAGDTDLVLSCRTESTSPDAPAVQQLLHLHVLWQQGYRLKASMREISQNASFHWYVYPAGNGAGQMVEYTGTGHVEMDRDGDRVTVRVIEAKLAPTTVTGRMNDPLGRTTLTGTLVGRMDRAETAVMLSDLRATVAAARRPRGTAVSAEAKLPLGQ
jgi:hypothetical protein